MGISLKEVSYSYIPKKKNRIYSLKNINLEIKENDEFIAIVGETGSGKSTLASLFNALKIPTDGEETVFGIKIKHKRKRKENYNSIRKHVGLVFQFSDYQLFEETVLKDVAFAPQNFGRSKEEAIEIAKKCLEKVEMSEEFYERSPFQLSGGEKKIVSIAGILAMEPDILVFDEPTAGLDPVTKRKVIKLFRELNRVDHKTVIIITHDMNIVNELANRVIVMNKGEIAIDTTPSDLFTNHPEIISSTNIGLPDTTRIANYLNEKFNLNVSNSVQRLDDFVKEILK